jgi:Ca2+-binding EF-hand superfamily protein
LEEELPRLIAGPSDFLAVPELAINPLGARVIAAFDVKRNDQVNFKQFCHTLAIFRPEASDAQKTDCKSERPTLGAPLTLVVLVAFRMYDVRGEGKITRRDLHAVLKRMVGDNIHDDQLWQLVHDACVAVCMRV